METDTLKIRSALSGDNARSDNSSLYNFELSALIERIKFSLTAMAEKVFLLTILKGFSENQNLNQK